MTALKFARRILPTLTFAAAFGCAPLAMAQTSTMAPMAPSTSTMAPMAPSTSTMAPSTMAPSSKAVKLNKALEFKNQAAAAAHCPSDTVVWASLTKSHTYHLAGTPRFGKTKHGAYMCKLDADAAGLHAAKM